MTRRMSGGVTLLVAALLSGSHEGAVSALAPGPSLPAAGVPAPGVAEQRHHYVLSVRVRPLVVFWIGRSNIGDAILTRAALSQEARYSLLIGSDPDRAPRRINRWGYIEEEIRGAEARLIGLMTESEEESIDQAEANLRR